MINNIYSNSHPHSWHLRNGNAGPTAVCSKLHGYNQRAKHPDNCFVVLLLSWSRIPLYDFRKLFLSSDKKYTVITQRSALKQLRLSIGVKLWVSTKNVNVYDVVNCSYWKLQKLVRTMYTIANKILVLKKLWFNSYYHNCT